MTDTKEPSKETTLEQELVTPATDGDAALDKLLTEDEPVEVKPAAEPEVAKPPEPASQTPVGEQKSNTVPQSQEEVPPPEASVPLSVFLGQKKTARQMARRVVELEQQLGLQSPPAPEKSEQDASPLERYVAENGDDVQPTAKVLVEQAQWDRQQRSAELRAEREAVVRDQQRQRLQALYDLPEQGKRLIGMAKEYLSEGDFHAIRAAEDPAFEAVRRAHHAIMDFGSLDERKWVSNALGSQVRRPAVQAAVVSRPNAKEPTELPGIDSGVNRLADFLLS